MLSLVHNVITQVFDGLKKAGLTAAKTVGEWEDIVTGKGRSKALYPKNKRRRKNSKTCKFGGREWFLLTA